MNPERRELKIIFGSICAVFLFSLCYPLVILFRKSVIQTTGGPGIENYTHVLYDSSFLLAIRNSFAIAGIEALITVTLAFILAYGLQYTRLPGKFKAVVQIMIMLPMFLPTLTYGFAVIYSFGKQGLITKLLGHQLIPIYGFWGMLLSYIIYTLPPVFILLYTAFKYVDTHYITVSQLMGDTPLQTFYITSVRPMVGSLAAGFILSFFLAFTDYGIPASIGGEYPVVALHLYMVMMGSIPDFQAGSAIAVIMLVPSVIAIALLHGAERFNFRYNKLSSIALQPDRLRDLSFGVVYICVIAGILSVFAIMFIVPFIKSWPYQIVFTTETLQRILSDRSIRGVFLNSLMVSSITAVCGTVLAYMAALVNARSHMPAACKVLMDAVAMIANTVPGMVLGVAYLFAFTGTPLQNTFAIIIILCMSRGFTTPYLMIKASLSKINLTWETTGELMGDSWCQTLFRVIIPNTMATVYQMLSYIFITTMVTISAIIFVTGARTMVMTTKIQEALYFEKFDEVFVLSLLIFGTNIVAKIILDYLSDRKEKKGHVKKT